MSLRGLRRVAALLGATGLGLTGCGPGVAWTGGSSSAGTTSDDSGSSPAGTASDDSGSSSTGTSGGSNEPCVVSLADVAEGDGGFVIGGEGSSHFSGQSVAGVGDLDGDGFDDVLIGARSYFNEAASGHGRPAVVFGKADTEAVELSSVAEGQGGFVLGKIWDMEYDESPTGVGWSVSGAGDINGDGMPDLLIGALYTGAYAVWGKGDTQPVSLEQVGQGVGGFHFSSIGDVADVGWAVSNAGDVNGDGAPDMIVGADYYCYWYPGHPSCPDRLRAYVVFGKADGEQVRASDLLEGQGGFAMELPEVHWTGVPVAGPGDMNGDGLADVVVAEPDAGRTYVVFGKTDTELVLLAEVAQGSGGFVVHGEVAIDDSGQAVAPAGDINGDGVPDLLIGDDSERVYVVFGKSDTDEVLLSEVAEGRGGFVVDEAEWGDLSGLSLSPAGDLSGDGVPDFLIGAPSADTGGGRSAGRTFVVFGKADTEPVSLADVSHGRGGFVLDGEGEHDESGDSVSSAGDVNGDGAPDLLIGAPERAAYTGRTYVVFGPPPDCATGG